MEKLIRFRLLVEKLNDYEFEQFTFKLIQLHGKSIIISSLFDHFNKNKQNNNQHQPKQYNITDVINIIKKIIDLRPNNNKNIDENKNDQLPIQNIAQLPSNLISETASFLDMWDYHNFQVSNRIVYVSCNSPCHLKELYLGSYNEHICLDHYPFVHDLKIDNVSDFNKRVNRQTFKFNHIQTLKIMKVKNNFEFDDFVNYTLDRVVNCNTVTTLFCDEFVSSNNTIETSLRSDLFLKLLSKFPNLNKIYIFGTFLSELDHVNGLQHQKYKLPPNLTCIFDSGTFCGDDWLGEKLVHFYASKLRSVCGDHWLGENSMKCPLLEEAFVYSSSQMKGISTSTSNLKRMSITMYRDEKEENTKKAIMNVIVTQNLLEMIECTAYLKHIDTFIQAMEIALFKTKLRQKNKFKIFVKVTEDDAVSWDDLLLYNRRILNAIASASIDNFMIRFELKLEDKAAKTGINDEMKMLKEQFDDKYYVRYFVYSESSCMISISNCDSFVCSNEYLLCD